MQIGKFTLVNEDKVHRALFGTMGKGGIMVGGVGEAASDEAKIAEYDRLGGLIKLDDDTVKKGCFYDFKKKMAFAEPKVLLVFKVNGKNIEVPADAPLPPLVRAAKLAEQGNEPEESDADEEDADPKPKKRSKKTTESEEDAG